MRGLQNKGLAYPKQISMQLQQVTLAMTLDIQEDEENIKMVITIKCNLILTLDSKAIT